MTRDELNQSNQTNILGAGKVTKNRHWTHNDNIADYVDESIVAIPENADVVAAIVEEVLNTDTIKDIQEDIEAIQRMVIDISKIIPNDGQDHVAELNEFFADIPDGSIIFFPKGVWILANANTVTDVVGKNNLRITGDWGGTVFQSLTGKGGFAGHNILFNNCTNIEIDHISTKEAILTQWSAYNNLLAFINTSNIHIHHCDFGVSQNKHIHIGGDFDNVLIEFNEFRESCINTNVITNNVFSSVFFAFDNVLNQSGKNVIVRGNLFEDNYLFAVSANNSRILESDYSNVFENFTITDNVIKNGTGGIVCRTNTAKIQNNYFENVGLSKILEAYDFIPELTRYYSKIRVAGGQPPTLVNTTTPLPSSVILYNGGENYLISGNYFKDCILAQDLPQGQTRATPLIIGGTENKRMVVTDNIIVDEVLPSGWTIPTHWAPHIRNIGTPIDVIVSNNLILLPEGYTGSYLININNPTRNFAANNRINIINATTEDLYGGTIYNGVSDGGVTQADLATKASLTGAFFSNTSGIRTIASATFDLVRLLNTVGAGQSLRFIKLQADDTEVVYSQITGTATAVTTGAASGAIEFYTRLAGTLAAKLRLDANGVLTYLVDPTANMGNLSLTPKSYVDSRRITVTQVIDFPSIPANSEGSGVNVTVTGATAADQVMVVPSANTVGIFYKAITSSNNTVTVYPCNFTASAIDPASITFKVTVIK